MENIFNVKRLSKKKYQIETTYNKYTVLVDEMKGIGIYLNVADTEPQLLVKTYDHCKMETAINYLWRKEMIY